MENDYIDTITCADGKQIFMHGTEEELSYLEYNYNRNVDLIKGIEKECESRPRFTIDNQQIKKLDDENKAYVTYLLKHNIDYTYEDEYIKINKRVR